MDTTKNDRNKFELLKFIFQIRRAVAGCSVLINLGNGRGRLGDLGLPGLRLPWLTKNFQSLLYFQDDWVTKHTRNAIVKKSFCAWSSSPGSLIQEPPGKRLFLSCS